MKKYLFIIAVFCFYSQAFAATYYADFTAGNDANTSGQAQSQATPWKHIPGMTGCASACASYSVQAGDIFVLKGGETWTFASTTANLITIGVSGITIQGGQQLGSPWGTGYPVIDGTGSTGIRSAIDQNSKSNIIIDGLKIVKMYYGAWYEGNGITITGGDSIEVKNCWVETEAITAFSISCSGMNVTNVSMHNNVFKNNGRAVINSDGQYDSDYHIDGFNFYDNQYLGTGTGDYGGYHLDGLMIQGNNLAAHGYGVRNVKIYRNRFAGLWPNGGSAILYFSGCTKGTAGGFVGTANMSGDSVDSVTVTNGGSNYMLFDGTPTPPNVHFVGGGGSGAAAHVTMSGTSVATVVMDNGGSGYTSTPAVTVYPGACSHEVDQGVGDYSTQNVEIYNNVIAAENTTSSSDMTKVISFGYGHHDNVKIYNNTISYDSVTTLSDQSQAMMFFNVSNLEVRNNIISGTQEGISVSAEGVWGDFKVTNNLYYNLRHTFHRLLSSWPGKGNADCRTIATCNANFKNSDGTNAEDGGTYGSNPLFITIPDGTVGSGNWHLQTGSPAATGGANLGAPYTTDLDGVVGTGRIGAYEYTEGATLYWLTVTKPTGGTVTSADAYINCGTGGNDCSYNYTASASVTLTFTPDSNFALRSTGGDCSGLGQCALTMSTGRTASASFTCNNCATLDSGGTLSIGAGGGTITFGP